MLKSFFYSIMNIDNRQYLPWCAIFVIRDKNYYIFLLFNVYIVPTLKAPHHQHQLLRMHILYYSYHSQIYIHIYTYTYIDVHEECKNQFFVYLLNLKIIMHFNINELLPHFITKISKFCVLQNMTWKNNYFSLFSTNSKKRKNKIVECIQFDTLSNW